MQISALLLPALATFALANEGIENDDVPDQCRDTCRSVVQQSESCDDQSFSSNDRELECICTGQNMAVAIPACEACVRPFWEASDDDDWDETNDLLRRCNLQTTTPTSSGSSTTPTLIGPNAGTGSVSGGTVTPTATTSTSMGPGGSQTVIVQTTTVPGGASGAFVTPAAGLAAILAVAVAL